LQAIRKLHLQEDMRYNLQQLLLQLNNITIEGSSNTITASAALTVGNLDDGNFQIGRR